MWVRPQSRLRVRGPRCPRADSAECQALLALREQTAAVSVLWSFSPALPFALFKVPQGTVFGQSLKGAWVPRSPPLSAHTHAFAYR